MFENLAKNEYKKNGEIWKIKTKESSMRVYALKVQLVHYTDKVW